MRYPPHHWIRSPDAPAALARYLDQQSKAYSRVKNHFIRDLLGDLKGRSVLDYGCGAGFFTVFAARAGAATVLGVDAESAVLDTARSFARETGTAASCEFVCSDRFPSFAAGRRFDVILMKDVIEHVEDDVDLVRTAAAHLSRAGSLIISTQNSLSLNFLTQGLYHRLLRGNKAWFGWDETHLRFYTFRSLGNLLAQAGLAPIAWRGSYLIPHKFPRRSRTADPGKFLRLEALAGLDRLLGRYSPFDRLGWCLLVKAGKLAEGNRGQTRMVLR